MRIVCIDGEGGYRQLARDELGQLLAAESHSLEWFEEGSANAERWAELAHGADGILMIGDRGPLPSLLFERCPSVKIVSFCGTGVRRFVDLERAAEMGVTVCNVPSASTESVAEHAIALMFAVARRLVEGDRIVRSGEWDKRVGQQLSGRTIGVVGAGPIGTSVIRRAHALGMTPLCWTHTPSQKRAKEIGAPFVGLDELFRESHIVTLHLAHVEETEHLINRELLGLLRSDAIFINTARAELVDNEFLA